MLRKVKNEILRKFWATVGSSFVGLKETDLFAGSFGWDIDCANSLAIRVKSSAGVLPLITRSNGFDQKRNFSGSFIVHHLMLFISLHLQSLACPDDLKYFCQLRLKYFYRIDWNIFGYRGFILLSTTFFCLHWERLSVCVLIINLIFTEHKIIVYDCRKRYLLK